jgi:hypothetical protein
MLEGAHTLLLNRVKFRRIDYSTGAHPTPPMAVVMPSVSYTTSSTSMHIILPPDALCATVGTILCGVATSSTVAFSRNVPAAADVSF